MAALTQPSRVLVRAAVPGEGVAIAALWRELWEAHEAWGGYLGSRDPRVYAQLAERLDDDARARATHPILGRHIHLVADVGAMACGQVEGWFERHGGDAATPITCEVRSLVVAERLRGLGAGRALLDELARAARSLSRGAPCVLAAEVLERNPAHAFYARVGYSPVAWTARIEAEVGADIRPGAFAARLAAPRDALPLAHLEAQLAVRRRAWGDARFDRPHALDASLVGGIASHLAIGAAASLPEPAILVAIDNRGAVRGTATFSVHSLEPPFVAMRRALMGRIAIDTVGPAPCLVSALVAFACRLALSRGALQVELTDLPAPGTELYEAAVATGARAWSRVVTKNA